MPGDLILHQNLQQITSSQRLVKRIDTAIGEALQMVSNILQTIPIIGSVIVAGMVWELGNPAWL
jgi:hypothetical protein